MALIALLTPVGSAIHADAGSPPAAVVDQGPATAPVISLIFDGGPGPETPAIVQLLRKAYVPATFFFAADAASQYPALVRSMNRFGNEVGDVGMAYIDLESLATPDIIAALSGAQNRLEKITGHAPRWFQAPYGDIDARITDIASSLNLRSVMWSKNSNDITAGSIAAITAASLTGVTNGDIIMFHDDGVQLSQSLPALQRVIDALKYRGFRFATLDELFGMAPLPSCLPNPARLFEQRGIHPYSAPIYRVWLSHLCRMISFGPATSPIRTDKYGIQTQPFAQYGREIVYDPTTGAVRVVVEWSWGAKIFSARKIAPNFRDPITRAWFDRYFHGDNPGAALSKEQTYGSYLAQHFARGWAIETRTSRLVRWQATFAAPRFT